jgi:hypothetical protein
MRPLYLLQCRRTIYSGDLLLYLYPLTLTAARSVAIASICLSGTKSSTFPPLAACAHRVPILLLVSMAISDRILDSGWIQGVCADVLSHTWPVRGGDQPRTTPMPFQRILTDFCGSPYHPRRAETAERATWGTKTPPRPPHSRHPPRPGSCAAETPALGPTGAHLGGLPGGGAPAAGALNPGLSCVAMHKAGQLWDWPPRGCG